MGAEEIPDSYFDDHETFVINWNPKEWKPDIDIKNGEMRLHKKGSTRDW